MKPYEEWLYRAEHDLESAEILLTATKPLHDIAVYHTQQCAEKSLKGYLAYREQEIEKIHSLIVLTNLCLKLNDDFAAIKEEALFLNPYATLYRYPEGELMPSIEETREAIISARKIFVFVKNKIDAEID